jgi:hypothetical protein
LAAYEELRDLMYIHFKYTSYTRLYGDRAKFVYCGRAAAPASHARLRPVLCRTNVEQFNIVEVHVAVALFWFRCSADCTRQSWPRAVPLLKRKDCNTVMSALVSHRLTRMPSRSARSSGVKGHPLILAYQASVVNSFTAPCSAITWFHKARLYCRTCMAI